jgi:hypothetical protein
MGAAASYARDRVRGRAANSEEPGCVEEEEASNQTERLPNCMAGSSYATSSPPPLRESQLMKRSMSKAVLRRSM